MTMVSSVSITTRIFSRRKRQRNNSCNTQRKAPAWKMLAAARDWAILAVHSGPHLSLLHEDLERSSLNLGNNSPATALQQRLMGACTAGYCTFKVYGVLRSNTLSSSLSCAATAASTNGVRSP